jgi:hypothetical protein
VTTLGRRYALAKRQRSDVSPGRGKLQGLLGLTRSEESLVAKLESFPENAPGLRRPRRRARVRI